MRGWISRYVISSEDAKSFATAMLGVGICLLLLAAFSGLWQAGLPGLALLVVAGYIYVIRNH